jgi:hypothetical protein
LFFLSPPLLPLLPAPPLLPLSMLQLLLPMLDSSAEAALTKHLRHTLSVCMNQTHALAMQLPHCKWLHPGQYLRQPSVFCMK